MSALRAAHPVFRQAAVLRRAGRCASADGDGLPDIAWFAPDGSEMSDEDWETGFAKSIAVYLNGQGIPDLDERGQRVTDDSFVLCFNAHHEPIDFALPARGIRRGVDAGDLHRGRRRRRRRSRTPPARR